MKTLLAAASVLALAYGFDAQEKETIRQSYPPSARVEIDNVDGSIHVTGYDGNQIQMVAEKTIVADSQDRLDAARREVKLDVSQSGDTLKFFVDGPFRCHCGDAGSGIHDDGHRGYRVTYDFDLKVPAAAIFKLATVNRGDVRIERTTGDYDLRNVNGGIELVEVSGRGDAHTVNGGIQASFAKNPAAACSFKTVNGSIEASFQPGLSADVRLKNFNGAAYTDFEVAALPLATPATERRGGRLVYRARASNGVRIGAGGPELKFDTLNGSIRILNRGQ
ncbi:MAG TPA: hypothetical protein VEV17_07570 [Bryobacteraceae bacterium]|nr:hypothetical protein [Bryobacteraceae bacterium]